MDCLDVGGGGLRRYLEGRVQSNKYETEKEYKGKANNIDDALPGRKGEHPAILVSILSYICNKLILRVKDKIYRK